MQNRERSALPDLRLFKAIPLLYSYLYGHLSKLSFNYLG